MVRSRSQLSTTGSQLLHRTNRASWDHRVDLSRIPSRSDPYNLLLSDLGRWRFLDGRTELLLFALRRKSSRHTSRSPQDPKLSDLFSENRKLRAWSPCTEVTSVGWSCRCMDQSTRRLDPNANAGRSLSMLYTCRPTRTKRQPNKCKFLPCPSRRGAHNYQ